MRTLLTNLDDWACCRHCLRLLAVAHAHAAFAFAAAVPGADDDAYAHDQPADQLEMKAPSLAALLQLVLNIAAIESPDAGGRVAHRRRRELGEPTFALPIDDEAAEHFRPRRIRWKEHDQHPQARSKELGK